MAVLNVTFGTCLLYVSRVCPESFVWYLGVHSVYLPASPFSSSTKRHHGLESYSNFRAPNAYYN